jgi:hypothetical protein
MRRHRQVWLLLVFMLAGLALAALIAIGITRPKPRGPKLQLVSCGLYNWKDPLQPCFGTAGFLDAQGRRSEDIQLGWALPKPNDDWHLAESNPGPGQGNSYVVLQNVKTGERVAYWDTVMSNPPLRPPMPFPLPPSLGVGCVGVMATPSIRRRRNGRFS